MPIVGTAEILILPNTAAFDRSLREGATPGLAGLKSDAEKAGNDAGDALGAGLGAGGRKAGADAEKGVKDGLGRVGADAERAGKDGGSKLTAGLGGALSGLSGVFGGLGLEMGPFSDALDKSGSKLAGVSTHSSNAKEAIANLGGTVAKVGTVGFLALAAGSLKLASDFEASTAAMAAAGNIPINTANKIGDAFRHEGSNVVYSAQQQMSAYGAVAGQMAAVQGKALTVGQTVGFMKSSMDLAEESGSNLSATTADLSQVMQTFQVPLSQTGTLTTQLYNASRVTGVGIDALTSTIDRMKARLGVAAPTVGDLSTLIVDLGEHGVTGSRGLLVVNTAINTLLASTSKLSTAQATTATKSAKAVQTAQDGVAKATMALSQAQQKQAADAGKSAAVQQSAADAVAKAQLGLTVAQQKLSDAQKSAGTITNANIAASAQLGLTVYDAQGHFVGMRDVIAQLQPKLEKMTQQQQLVALSSVFGASANKALLTTVLAGPAAYDKAAKAVNDQAAAHHALEVQQHTLQHELESTKVSVENMATGIGLDLMPIVKGALSGFGDFIGFLQDHEPVLIAVGVLFGTVLAGAVAVWAYTVGEKAVASTKKMIEGLGKLFGAGQAQQASTDAQAASSDAAAGSADTLTGSLRSAAAAMNSAAEAMQRLAGAETEAAASGVEAAASQEALGAAADTVSASLDAEAASAGAADAASLPIIVTVGLIVAAVAALAFGIYELVTHWSAVWNQVKAGAEDAYHFLDGIWHSIDRGIRDAFGKVEAFFKQWWVVIVATVFGGELGLLVGLFIKFHKDIFAEVSKLAADVAHFFERMWNDVTGFATRIWHDVTGFFGKMATDIGRDVSNGVDAVVRYFTALPGRIVAGLGNIAHAITQPFVGIADWVNTNVIQPIVHFFEGLPGKIGGAIAGIPGQVAGTLEKAIPGGSAIGGAVSAVGSFLGLDQGGEVPGAPGAPHLAVVHAGEYVFTQAEYASMKNALGGRATGGIKNPALAAALGSMGGSAGGGGPASPVSVGGGVTVAEGAVQQTFMTPMEASEVANEVGWNLRTVAVNGLRGPR